MTDEQFIEKLKCLDLQGKSGIPEMREVLRGQMSRLIELAARGVFSKPLAKKKPRKSSREVSTITEAVLIAFPTNQIDQFYPVIESQRAQFMALYPGIDIDHELRAMAGWLLANPRNRKTYSGTLRFINSWLSREQNRSKPNGHGKPSNNDNWLAGAAELAAELRSNGK
jgi:hypothetical protein